MKKILLSILAVACLLAALTACGRKDGQQSTDSSASEEQTISGIVNQLDDYLILLGSDEQYHIFDFGEDVDPSSLEEGDSVTVTYTGTLDGEESSPVAVSIQKEE